MYNTCWPEFARQLFRVSVQLRRVFCSLVYMQPSRAPHLLGVALVQSRNLLQQRLILGLHLTLLIVSLGMINHNAIRGMVANIYITRACVRTWCHASCWLSRPFAGGHLLYRTKTTHISAKSLWGLSWRALYSRHVRYMRRRCVVLPESFDLRYNALNTVACLSYLRRLFVKL